MAKPPVDKGNTTMPLSDSQVVAVTPAVAKNDQSLWKGLVVPSDEFAPAKRPSRAPRYVIFGVLGAGAIGGGIYALTRGSSDEPPPAAPAVMAPPPAPAPPDAAPAVVTPPVDAAAPAAVAPPIDAAPAPVPAPPKKRPTKKVTKRHAR